jgi:hypothetical protein
MDVTTIASDAVARSRTLVRIQEHSGPPREGLDRLQLTHNGSSAQAGLVRAESVTRIQPSGIRVVRVRIKELLAVDLIVGDRVLAFRRD